MIRSTGVVRKIISLIFVVVAFLLLCHLMMTAHLPTQQAVSKQSPPVQYDFYNILPNISVRVDSETAVYFLQTASVRRVKEAERIRNQMLAQKYPVLIQSYKINNTIWYRVMIGPYNSFEAVQRTQQQMKKEGFNSFLVKTNLSKN